MREELVTEAGGLPLRRLSDLQPPDLPGDGFLAVLVEEEEILPALAALTAPQAVAMLALADVGAVDLGQAEALRARLEKGDRSAYLLKSGRVGGSDPELSVEITQDHVRLFLDAIQAEALDWEEDPDFGWRLAPELAGLEGTQRFLMVPRFLYARTDRVYEYAARVSELKRDWTARLSTRAGLEAAIIDDLGWIRSPTDRDRAPRRPGLGGLRRR